MKNLYPVLNSVIFLLMLSISGCERDEIFPPYNNSKNNPVIINVPDSFSFEVNADNFNYSKMLQLYISTDTLAVKIIIVRLTSGSGYLEIKDGVHTSIYLKDLSSQINGTDVFRFKNKPGTLALTLSQYTGEVKINITHDVQTWILKK